jgi:hypothetical protein
MIAQVETPTSPRGTCRTRPIAASRVGVEAIIRSLKACADAWRPARRESIIDPTP